MTEPLLHVDGLTAWYRSDVPVLRDVALPIGAHSIVGLLGTNGAGKTTLINTLVSVHERFRLRGLAWRGHLSAIGARVSGGTIRGLHRRPRLRAVVLRLLLTVRVPRLWGLAEPGIGRGLRLRGVHRVRDARGSGLTRPPRPWHPRGRAVWINGLGVAAFAIAFTVSVWDLGMHLSFAFALITINSPWAPSFPETRTSAAS